jgi:tubulin-specific chaperone A
MQNKVNKKKNRHGLAFILFWWFISLPIGPLLILGFIEYSGDKAKIINNKYEQIKAINFLLTKRVNNFFETALTNMYMNAEISENLLESFNNTIINNNYTLDEFIKSTDYQQIKTGKTEPLVKLLRFYNYKDILLLDKNSNILFSINSPQNSGKNLLSNNSEKLNNILDNSVYSHTPKYADLIDFFGKTTNLYILPLFKKDSSILGFIAIQLDASNINDVFFEDLTIDENEYSYLVNNEGNIAYSSNNKYYAYNNDILKNPSFINWQNNLTTETNDLDEGLDILQGMISDNSIEKSTDENYSGFLADKSEKYNVYNSHFNQMVIGSYLNINISGTNQVLISEFLLSEALNTAVQFRNRLIIIIGISFILVLILALFISRRLVKPIKIITTWVNKVASGDYVAGEVLEGSSEITKLSHSFNDMSSKLRNISKFNEERTWLQDGMSGLNNSLRGELKIEDLAKNVVGYIARYLDMQFGAIYVLEADNLLQLVGSFAWNQRKQDKNSFNLGEGLIGQVALEKKTIELTKIPEDFIDIRSGMGISKPSKVIIIPLLHEEELKGVVEFATLNNISELEYKFIDRAIPSIAIAINSAQYRTRVNNLLETTTKQSARLKQQQHDLQKANEELETRAHILEESENKLKLQSQALQKSNIKLEEKSKELMSQKQEIEQKNADIEQSNKKILEKAQELEKASSYKSEFLANMSHELRTPLNSMLLLAKMLYENEENNLTDDQIDSAKVIFNSGNELLELINDILDLSKVEVGKLSVNLELEDLDDVTNSLQALFNPIASNKNLQFEVIKEQTVPSTIITDKQRLLQILKNFLSNAFKFTEQGKVTLAISLTENNFLNLAVIDTGIGIPKDKQPSIFESFQQADGSISRKYGGTGLGLSISVQLAKLLGGSISLESEENKGTTFTLSIPLKQVCIIKDKPQVANDNNEIVEEYKVTNAKPQPKQINQQQTTASKDDCIDNSILTNKTVIIVDSNAKNSFAISGDLENAEAVAVLLKKQKQLLDTINNQPADIIIIVYDANNKFDIQQFKELEQVTKNNKQLLIVATTSTKIKQDLTNNGSEFINYPIRIEQIIEKVKQ